MFSFAECIFVVAPNIKNVAQNCEQFVFLRMLWSPYLPSCTCTATSPLIFFLEWLNDEGSSPISTFAVSCQQHL